MRQSGTYYDTDPDDPTAPIELEEYNGIKVGDTVTYHNPHSMIGLDGEGPLRVDAFYRFVGVLREDGDYICAILNGGAYECNADNLKKDD
jgi:hypothetical protein